MQSCLDLVHACLGRDVTRCLHADPAAPTDALPGQQSASDEQAFDAEMATGEPLPVSDLLLLDARHCPRFCVPGLCPPRQHAREATTLVLCRGRGYEASASRLVA